MPGEDTGDGIKSSHPDITILNPQMVPLEVMRKRILDLEIFSRGLDIHAMLRKLQELVPTFEPADLHGLPASDKPQTRTDSAQTESSSDI